MTRTRFALAVAAIAVGTLVYAASGHASGRFSDRTIRGVYGFSGAGTLAGGTIQAAIAGLNAFDGAGGCAIRARLNIAGGMHDVNSVSCTYQVHGDGTGSLEVTLDAAPPTPLPLPPFHSDFVIVDNAKAIHAVLSDAAGLTVATSVSVRQHSGERD
jgi:hypothetical protein